MSIRSERWRTPTGVEDIPTPVVEIIDISWNNVSSFKNDTLSGLNSVWVKNPDFNNKLFKASNMPTLDLAWYRIDRGTPRNKKGWSFPDDAIIKTGGDQGAGTQMSGAGDTASIRRSRWDVAGSVDFEYLTGSRIELEHYFKLQNVKLLSDSVEPATNWPTISIPVPTFIPPVAMNKVFSTSQFDVLRTTPRYHGYQNAYFAFAFSIKDPKGNHPGDRLRGPLSQIIQVRASSVDGTYPIWPNSQGYAEGENAITLKAFIV